MYMDGEGDDFDPVECRYCGESGLHWDLNDNDEWRLYDEYGDIHHCGDFDIDDAEDAFDGIAEDSSDV